ncbi:cupredoxin family copper-binding protein [Candidatus Falkowbacteria bacterium]|nr:cupredoxin family copper-binding protein [Candidatus Falkowbacteria bacterium]
MKKIYFIIFALLAVALLGAGCLPSYGTPETNAPQTGTPVINSNTEYFPPTNMNVSTPAPVNTNQPVPTTVTVDIRNFVFDPANLTVNAGTTVKWENYDSVGHKIAGTGFDSNQLNQGDSYSFTFNQAGTYDYHCAIHPSMTGTITVQ